ncbi:MAG: winged helix-turn-helix domain-containing protein [Candidatus Saliniplasma sp.]
MAIKIGEGGAEHSFKDAVDELTEQFNLTPEERSKLLLSGSDRVFRNREGWVRTHLKKAGLIG